MSCKVFFISVMQYAIRIDGIRYLAHINCKQGIGCRWPAPLHNPIISFLSLRVGMANLDSRQDYIDFNKFRDYF